MSFDRAAVVHAYEALAEGYVGRFGDDLHDNAFDRAVLDGALDLLGPSARILDLGCGPGQVASYVSERSCQAMGVDLTPAMLGVAQELHPGIPLIQGDLLQLPVRSGALDGTIAWFSLHNLPRALLGQALREMRRVLRPAGVFVMVTHGGTGEEIVENDQHGAAEQLVLTYHDVAQLRSALSHQRFEIIDVRSREPLEHEHPAVKVFITAAAR